MSLFKDMLKGGETLFRDTIILDYDFQPKILKYRENEQMRFATAIKPLLQNRNGKNLFVYGAPGIGKTTACKHVLRELEETSEDIIPLYVNCWKHNTTFKIYHYLCEELGFKFIQSKKTSELFDLIKKTLNKKAVVLIFDEIDKLEDMDFLYTILEDIYRKSLILITNYRDMYSDIDERIRSRLAPEFVFFKPYTQQEVAGILRQRAHYAFVENVFEDDAFNEIVEMCVQTNDVRIGLYVMKEAGNIAEEKSSRKITVVHVGAAIKKAQDFHIKPKSDLDEDLQLILNLVRDNTGKKIGDIFSTYQKTGGQMSYKSFQRRVMKLNEGRFISTQKTSGKEGNSTLLHYASNTKLTDF